MNKLASILNRKLNFIWVLLLSITISSCGTSKGVTQEDGIYAQTKGTKVVVKENKSEEVTQSKKVNYFADELQKYEDEIEGEKDEIILDAEEYVSDEYGNEEESNAAWGYDVKEVYVTHHMSYDWYHPYHSYGYFGNIWGYNNWYYPSYRYRPWGYYNYYYGNGYYNPYYGSYNPYYNNYGYYYNNYYGGYGYNSYNPRYINRYGRRGHTYGVKQGRRSLSKSVANVNHSKSRRSIIRGSGRELRNANSKMPNRRNSNAFKSKPNNTRVRGANTPTRKRSVRRTTPTRTNTPHKANPRYKSASPRSSNTKTRNQTGTKKRFSSAPKTRRSSSRNTSSSSGVKSSSSYSGSKSSSTRSSSSTGRSGRSSSGSRSSRSSRGGRR